MSTEPGPIAAATLRHLREAKEHSELNLRNIVNGPGPIDFREYVEFVASQMSALGLEVAVLAAHLDDAIARIRQLEGG